MDASHTESHLLPFSSGKRRPTRVFRELLNDFRLSYSLLIVMNLTLCGVYVWQYNNCMKGCYNQCDDEGDSYLITWELAALVSFGCQAIYYLLAVSPAFHQSLVINFASFLSEEIVEEEVDIPKDEPYDLLSQSDKSKQRKLLSNLIAGHFRSRFKAVQMMYILFTLLHLSLVFSGIVLFLAKEYSTIMFTTSSSFINQCEFSSTWLTFSTIILICIAKKNSLQITVLLVTASPILLCYVSMKLFRRDEQQGEGHSSQHMSEEQFKAIPSVMYHPKSIQGDDHSCSICRTDYAIDQSLKVLPCSDLHHFHETCIQTWFKISDTCPLCRFSFEPLQPQSTLPLPQLLQQRDLEEAPIEAYSNV